MALNFTEEQLAVLLPLLQRQKPPAETSTSAQRYPVEEMLRKKQSKYRATRAQTYFSVSANWGAARTAERS
jgi:hypothetical protein